MNEDRVKDKIQKLLRLAESDNPHEAERAKTQAKALMAKHSLDGDELDIIEKAGTPIPRQNPKDYESGLIATLLAISGCEAIIKSSPQVAGSRVKWSLHPIFIGPETEAEIAAYTWDVLLLQMNDYRKELKKEYPGIKAAQSDVILMGWSQAVAGKILKLFPKKETHKAATKSVKKQTLNEARSRKTKMDQTSDTNTLAAHGYNKGLQATLNQAAHHTSDPTLRINHS